MPLPLNKVLGAFNIDSLALSTSKEDKKGVNTYSLSFITIRLL